MPDFAPGDLARPLGLRGRMPVALILALVASLGLHVVALFGPEIESVGEPDLPPLVAELKPLPPQPVQSERVPPAMGESEQKQEKAAPAKQAVSRAKSMISHAEKAVVGTAKVIPDAGAGNGGRQEIAVPLPTSDDGPDAATPANESSTSEIVAPRLPPRGSIRFRVDRGDSKFEIGAARQEWEFDAGRYRLRSVVETTGLAWLLRSVLIEMESIGRISETGLQPEAFGVLREGRRAREKALFDWEAMKLRVSDRPAQELDPGAQDLLSFYYQLGFMNIPDGGSGTMHLATGKKYGLYRLENLGDEDIEIPLGVLRTRHLRAPGENSTELWLAYDYRLLPVKIRHVDNKGGILVQVATEINFGQ